MLLVEHLHSCKFEVLNEIATVVVVKQEEPSKWSDVSDTYLLDLTQYIKRGRERTRLEAQNRVLLANAAIRHIHTYSPTHPLYLSHIHAVSR